MRYKESDASHQNRHYVPIRQPQSWPDVVIEIQNPGGMEDKHRVGRYIAKQVPVKKQQRQ